MPRAGRFGMFIAPFFIIAGLFIFKAIDRNLYWTVICREDGPIENLTAIFYFAAGVIAMLSAGRMRGREDRWPMFLCLLMAAMFFLNALEEISWGQRIFGIHSPEFFRRFNQKHETNFHNILNRNMLHLAFIVVSAYGLCAFLFVPKLADRLFGARFRDLTPFIVPPWFVAPYFLPTLFIYLYYEMDETLARHFGDRFLVEFDAGTRSIFIVSDQEPAECIMSLGFLLFILFLHRGLKSRRVGARDMRGMADGSLSGPSIR